MRACIRPVPSCAREQTYSETILSKLFYGYALGESCRARKTREMGDELVHADLKEIPVGSIRRGSSNGFFMPLKLPAPLTDLEIGEVGTNLVRKLIANVSAKQ